MTLFIVSDDDGETKRKGPGEQIQTPFTYSIKEENKRLQLCQTYFHPHFKTKSKVFSKLNQNQGIEIQ